MISIGYVAIHYSPSFPASPPFGSWDPPSFYYLWAATPDGPPPQLPGGHLPASILCVLRRYADLAKLAWGTTKPAPGHTTEKHRGGGAPTFAFCGSRDPCVHPTSPLRGGTREECRVELLRPGKTQVADLFGSDGPSGNEW